MTTRKSNLTTISQAGIKSLYKFKSFDSKLHYQELLNNIFYFPSRSQLNDPFDSQIPIRYDLCNKKELFKLAENIDKIENPNSDRSERRKRSKDRAKIVRLEMIQDPSLVQNRVDQHIESQIGIFSLSEKLNNLLLWTHYTNSHRGFCIEVDAQYLSNLLISGYFLLNKKAIVGKVLYQKKFPFIHPLKHSYNERIELQFFTKSDNWKYEEEWRVLKIDGSKSKEKLPPDVIKNIFFGMWANDEDINTSITILQKSNPKIGTFKAIKKNEEFGLEFKRF